MSNSLKIMNSTQSYKQSIVREEVINLFIIPDSKNKCHRAITCCFLYLNYHFFREVLSNLPNEAIFSL